LVKSLTFKSVSEGRCWVAPPPGCRKGLEIMAERVVWTGEIAETWREITESAAAVAESWFRNVNIPDDAIPALLKEYAKGAPGRDHWERIAEEWQWQEAERLDRERREKNDLPPLPSPGPITVADLAAEIRTLQAEWISEPDDRDNRFWAPCRLGILWNKARRIPGAAPPPRLAIAVKQPVRDMQEAIGALDDLLRWCDENKPGHSSEPAAALVPDEPKKILASWREILVALGLKDNREDKQKVDRLNKAYSGPITIPGQGRQPIVDGAKLIEWWDNLAVMAQAENRERDAEATVGAQYDYGRDSSKVVPAISGHVQERRLSSQAGAIQEARNELSHALGRRATDAEVAGHLGISEQAVIAADTGAP
jgi:hypothetical protein